MGFIDKAKAAATQAAAKAKQTAGDVQLKVDLGAAYDELGKAAFELIEKGELAHPALDEKAAKVRELRQRMEKAEPDEAASEPLEEGEAPAPDTPPG